MNDFLHLNGIFKQTGSNLQPISFTIKQFQKTAIMGETGSGKSTVMKIIGGLSQPDGGEAFFLGEKVKGPNDKLIPGHPGIAYLSQHFELFNNYYVHELLEYASKLPDEEANTIFEICKISHLLKRRTDQLSGGERQRIALARQLVRLPKLLLLDEPFSNLDMVNKRIIKQVIDDISKSLNITCILVSHDPEDVLSWADEVLIFQNGEMIQQGSPKEIYFNPINAYAASLTGDYNLIETSSTVLREMFDILEKHPAFIRPEHIQFTEQGMNATVKDIVFCGDHTMVEVQTAEQSLLISTQLTSLQPGDAVKISLSTKR
jgi:ABC-type sugar transport system ATPase subunit